MTQAFQHQQQPWTVSLRAKAKNLDFKIKLSRILPLCKLSRFSIQFKLQNYVFEVESKPKSSCSLNPKCLKLRFLQIFKNFQCKGSRNKSIVRSWFGPKNYLYGRRGRRKTCIWLWVLLLLFAMVGCFVITVQLSYIFRKGFVWKCLWKAWNSAAPPGLLHRVSEAIFNRICQPLGF